jgi:hypothetical protein
MRSITIKSGHLVCLALFSTGFFVPHAAAAGGTNALVYHATATVLDPQVTSSTNRFYRAVRRHNPMAPPVFNQKPSASSRSLEKPC